MLILHCVAMGPPNHLQVFHLAAQVAVLKKVLGNFYSSTVRELLSPMTHCLCKQEIRPEKKLTRFVGAKMLLLRR